MVRPRKVDDSSAHRNHVHIGLNLEGPGCAAASGVANFANVAELSSKNRIHVEVDRGLCIGSADCVDTAPDVFRLDDEDIAIVVDPDGASTDDILEAAANCPVTAISIVGEDGDLFP